jgi:hypothetical protein
VIYFKNTNAQPPSPRHAVAYFDRKPGGQGPIPLGGTFIVHFREHARARVEALALSDIIVLHQCIGGHRRVVSHVVQVAAMPPAEIGGDFPIALTVRLLGRLRAHTFGGHYIGQHHMMIAGIAPHAPQIGDVAWQPVLNQDAAPDYTVPNGSPWQVYGGTAVRTARLLEHCLDAELYESVNGFAELMHTASVLDVNH